VSEAQAIGTRAGRGGPSGAAAGEVTILFGGFTETHHRLLAAAWQALGYRAEPLPTPDLAALQVGKELGNPGQCNPTYFTVGNLLKRLRELERSGLSRDEIIRCYVFVTAGACGPCRFGMYAAEYRLALRNAGFEGFRVLLFQQKDGLSQGIDAAGIRYDVDFFLGLLITMIVADQLNDLAYQVRPFEVIPGETDAVLGKAVDDLAGFFAQDTAFRGPGSRAGRLREFLGLRPVEGGRLGWLRLLGCGGVARRLEAIAEDFRSIEVDYLRVLPVVKITGEFWAQVTEGDGNFGMFRFLEDEGAQVRVEPVSAWIIYLIHQARRWESDRRWLPSRPRLERLSGSRPAGSRWRRVVRSWRLAVRLRLAEVLFKGQWGRFRRALGGTPHALVDQNELERLGHPYYHARSRGGEGHLEVAENIYFATRGLAHMVLSLKPFGCMPSSQSDGVQSAVVSHFPDMTFLPIETAGEGRLNAHSRVELALSEAREKACGEYLRAVQDCGLSEESIRAHVASRPELRRGLLDLPPGPCAGTAARFVHRVAASLGEPAREVQASGVLVPNEGAR
jgi:predicted nucleotide-binding protein (sugar kinase/HSP70/actin superfamily)